MRAAQSLRLVSALTLMLGCSDTTGPNPDPAVRRHPAPDLALVVGPTGASIVRGESIRFTATPVHSLVLPAGDVPASWFSSNESVATVDASGVVRGVSVGTAVITAVLRGARGSAAIRVIGMRKKVEEPLPCLLAGHPAHPKC